MNGVRANSPLRATTSRRREDARPPASRRRRGTSDYHKAGASILRKSRTANSHSANWWSYPDQRSMAISCCFVTGSRMYPSKGSRRRVLVEAVPRDTCVARPERVSEGRGDCFSTRAVWNRCQAAGDL